MNQSTNKGINLTSNGIISKQCRNYSNKESPLNKLAIKQLIKQTPDWRFVAKKNHLARRFHFQNYYQTIDFVNNLADICHEQDHHPELKVSYKICKVTFTNHSVNGVTENDFICAAIIDRMMLNQPGKN